MCVLGLGLRHFPECWKRTQWHDIWVFVHLCLHVILGQGLAQTPNPNPNPHPYLGVLVRRVFAVVLCPEKHTQDLPGLRDPHEGFPLVQPVRVCVCVCVCVCE